MSFNTCQYAFSAFLGRERSQDGTARAEGMRHFTDEAVIFLYDRRSGRARVISSRAATGRFATGASFDTDEITERTPCFEYRGIPSAELSLGAVLFPLEPDGEIPYDDAHELAAVFDPRFCDTLFKRSEREMICGIKSCASFCGCGYDYLGMEGFRISFAEADRAINVAFLIISAMMRRHAMRRGFNFKLESSSGVGTFAISADLCVSGRVLEDELDFKCLKQILEHRGLPLMYRFADNCGTPRLIMRFASSRVSLEALLRAVTPADKRVEAHENPDILGKY